MLRRAYANAPRIGQVTVLSNLYEWEGAKHGSARIVFSLVGRIYLELSGRGGHGWKDCRFTHITGLGRSSDDCSVLASSSYDLT